MPHPGIFLVVLVAWLEPKLFANKYVWCCVVISLFSGLGDWGKENDRLPAPPFLPCRLSSSA